MYTFSQAYDHRVMFMCAGHAFKSGIVGLLSSEKNDLKMMKI